VRTNKIGFYTEHSEHKKINERSEFRMFLLFIKFSMGLTKNCPEELSESEVQ